MIGAKAARYNAFFARHPRFCRLTLPVRTITIYEGLGPDVSPGLHFILEACFCQRRRRAVYHASNDYLVRETEAIYAYIISDRDYPSWLQCDVSARYDDVRSRRYRTACRCSDRLQHMDAGVDRAGGIMLAITPIIGQLLGSGKRESISSAFMQGIYLSIVISLLLIVAGLFALEPVLALMNIEDPEVYRVAKHYLIAISFGIVPFFASQVTRYFFDAQGFTRITMIIILLGLPVNAFFNYVLIFGKLGFPELGGVGSGYATAITFWLILLVSIWFAMRVPFRSYQLFLRWPLPSLKAWWEQLRIGVPIGLSIFFEASSFSIVTLLIASMFDTITVAAHQVVMSFTSLIFMIPLSISMALTIMVAFEIGANRVRDARQYTMLGVFGAIGIMAVTAVFLYFGRESIAYIYNNQREVIELAM